MLKVFDHLASVTWNVSGVNNKPTRCIKNRAESYFEQYSSGFQVNASKQNNAKQHVETQGETGRSQIDQKSEVHDPPSDRFGKRI